MSYQNESFSSKWEQPFLLPSSLVLWRKERARKAALILMKNSHFDRTLRYLRNKRKWNWQSIEEIAQSQSPNGKPHHCRLYAVKRKACRNSLVLQGLNFTLFFIELIFIRQFPYTAKKSGISTKRKAFSYAMHGRATVALKMWPFKERGRANVELQVIRSHTLRWCGW